MTTLLTEPPENVASQIRESLLPEIAADLQTRIGAERWQLWFDGKTTLHLAGDVLTVAAQNAFAANWIRTKFIADLRAAAAHVLARDITIAITIDASTASPARDASAAGDHPMLAPRPNRAAPTASLLNPRYILDEFVVGPSNQLAYHAAMQVSQAAHDPGKQWSPLFLHGACGLGKTHLLQGICQRFARLHPEKRWLYLTGEAFTNDFLDALRTHKTDAFRKRLRQADLLIIDDVHFLANKKATQEEFLHTFNQIDATGKQVVLASDCAPRHIAAMTESLISRFVSGMVLRIDPPDLPTRLAILRRKATRARWNLSDAVLMHVAQSPASSVREIEGLLLQVVAGMSLLQQAAPHDAAAVLAEIRDRTTVGRGPIAVERIVNAVADYFVIAPAAILGSGREKTTAAARALAMHLCRQHTGMSFPEIGRALGKKNHSTVIAACQRIEALLASGELLRWTTNHEPRHETAAEILRTLEAALRKPAR